MTGVVIGAEFIIDDLLKMNLQGQLSAPTSFTNLFRGSVTADMYIGRLLRSVWPVVSCGGESSDQAHDAGEAGHKLCICMSLTYNVRDTCRNYRRVQRTIELVGISEFMQSEVSPWPKPRTGREHLR